MAKLLRRELSQAVQPCGEPFVANSLRYELSQDALTLTSTGVDAPHCELVEARVPQGQARADLRHSLPDARRRCEVDCGRRWPGLSSLLFAPWRRSSAGRWSSTASSTQSFFVLPAGEVEAIVFTAAWHGAWVQAAASVQRAWTDGRLRLGGTRVWWCASAPRHLGSARSALKRRA